MSSTSPAVLLSIEGGIAAIRFNRSQSLNAIDETLARAFSAAVREALSNKQVRVVVLSGEGRAFMAGGDLQAFRSNLPDAPITAGRIIDPLNDAVAMLAEGDPPVIASVHGAVAGAGLSIALGADFVIASDDAKFVPAYSRIAATPDGGGTWAITKLVGLRKAMEIALLAEPFEATTALSLGIVTRVVAASVLAVETQSLAIRLAQGPTRTLGRTRRLLRDGLNATLRDQLEAERDAFAACGGSADFAEGLDAFFEKRPPRFTGS